MSDQLIRIAFESGDEATADLIDTACREALPLIHASWGLAALQDCRIYVMTSWLKFIFQAAPWPWRTWLAVSFPV